MTCESQLSCAYRNFKRYVVTVPSRVHPLGWGGYRTPSNPAPGGWQCARPAASRPQDGWRYRARLAWGDRAAVPCCEVRGGRSERLVQTRGQCERAAERLPGEQLGQTSVPADVRSTLAGVQDVSKVRRAVRRQQRDRLGAGMTQDSHPSPPTGKERRERRLLCGARQPRCAET